MWWYFSEVSKKKQDIRVDLPTVGFQTFKQCKLAGLKGIVLKHKRNILLDKKKCIKYADKNKMFITKWIMTIEMIFNRFKNNEPAIRI